MSSSSGWVKRKDPNTGMDYYANYITRQTQWEVPPGFVDEQQQHQQQQTNARGSTSSRGSNYSLSSSGFGSFKNTNTNANVNASNGTGSYSNGSHSSSYSNNTRKPYQSSSRNNTMNSTSTTATAGAASNYNQDDSLPPGWERMYDKGSGKYFYVDHANKITSWERPTTSSSSSSQNGNGHHASSSAKKEGMATGFGFIPKSALDRSSNNQSSRSSSSRGNNNNNSHSSNPTKKMGASSATSPSWQYYGSNPPPSTASPKARSYSYSSSTTSSHNHHHNDDMSTKYYQQSKLDYTVQKVPDRLRPTCPSCDVIFSIPLKRRHHCRLCQDVFCDTCSSGRASLPFDGEEYTKPVRVCTVCQKDVENGNFFSMRRYLTPLQLYDGKDDWGGSVGGGSSDSVNGDDKNREFTSKNVCAALSSLTEDLEALLLDSTSFTEKVTISPEVLVPAICRHLKSQDTCDYAIKVLATLLSLGNVVGDDRFLMEVYTQAEYNIFDDVLTLLEWSGSSTKTLAVQEQAAQTLFYLTDSKVIAAILSMGDEKVAKSMEREGWSDDILRRCDIHRALRSVLDHTTQTMSPSLQRWSSACICNLIADDYRRSCEAINYAMAMGSQELKYDSFTMEMVSSGGLMILSSLVSSDDSDTRAYAMKALSAIIDTSRELNIQLGVLREAYGIESIGGSNNSDSNIIDGIVSAGACSPLTQLLLSADDGVASMGCSFARSLVHPLLTNPLGSVLPCYHRLLSVLPNTSPSTVGNEDGLGTYRNAALQMASSDGILSALIHLICDNMSPSSRPIELKRSAMEILAAIAMTLSFWDSKVKAMGTSIEGNAEWEILKQQLDMALVTLEEEGIGEAASVAFSSASISSINTSRDSPSSQLREAASLVMSAMAACSASAASHFISCNVVARLITTATDDGYASASARGEWASRRLAMMEAIAMILVQGWKTIQVQTHSNDASHDEYKHDHGNSGPLGLLLESLDAGIIPLLSRLIDSRVELSDAEHGYGDIRMKIALCHIIGALFGIGQCDQTNIGFARIFEALGNTHYLIPITVALLGSTINATQQHSGASQRPLPIPALLEANLLALGSMCGSRYCSFNSVGIGGDKAVLQMDMLAPEDKDVFSCQFEEVCISTCDIITKNSFLASSLVGAYGEGSIMPTIRLASAIAENGPERTHQLLARCGVLLPVSDMLRDALVAGDFYVFASCVSLTSICGPQLTSNSENSGIQSLRGCVQMLSNVLTIDEGEGDDPSQTKVLSSLKRKCVFAIERLSNNSGLWVTIVTHFIPCVSDYLIEKVSNGNQADVVALAAGLKVILRVVSLPSHALTIAQTNIGASLAEVICNASADDALSSSSNDIEALALQVLHSLISETTRQQAYDQSLEIDVLNAACSVLSREIDESIAYDFAPNTKLALEMINLIVSDMEVMDDASASSSPRVMAFVETVAMYPDLMKRLCATLLHLGGMNEKSEGCPVEPMYGSTILLFEGTCGTFDRSLDAAIYLMYRVAFYSALVNSGSGEEFWQIFSMEDQRTANVRTKTATKTAACAIFLSVLVDEVNGMCVPQNKVKLDFFQHVSLPLIRERLLDGLHSGVEEFASMKNDADSVVTFRYLLETYNIPQSCFGLCNSPLMLDSAFQVLEIILAEFSDILVQSVVSDIIPLTALFNLLSVSKGDEQVKTKPEMIRIFAAVTLSAAGKLGILGPAVKRHSLRSLAIASLSAACLMEEQDSVECLAEDLTGDGASISTLCLRGIVDVLTEPVENESSLVMSPAEAKAISSSLGKKLSTMVIEQFMKRESGDYNFGDEEEVGKLPEVVLICALATYKDSLAYLCNQGGLEALSLLSAEGLKPAIVALHDACKIDSESVLKVDGHASVMQVIAHHAEEMSGSVKEACMDLLATVCSSSKKGKEVVSSTAECSQCITFASDCITDHAKKYVDNSSTESECDLLDTMTQKAPNSTPKSIEMDDYNITLLSISFLSSLTHIKETRMEMIKDGKLKDSLSLMLEVSPSHVMKFAIASFLAALGRYVKDFSFEESQYSIEGLSMMLLSTFNPKQGARFSVSETSTPLFGDFSEMHHYNDNLVLATVCKGFEHMLCHMPQKLVHDILSEVLGKFSDMIKYEMRITKKIAMKTKNSGLLVSNISSILIHCAHRLECQNEIMTESVLCDLLRLILLNPGEKIGEGRKEDSNNAQAQAMDVEKTNWECSVTHCLQCLALLSVGPLELDNGKTWDDIMSNVESEIQVTRRGKRANSLRMVGAAGQKSNTVEISVVGSLNAYVNNQFDRTGSVAAKKVLENLDLI